MISLVFMGVSGCGKSSAAAAVASRLGLPLIEGDHYHPLANVQKMQAWVYWRLRWTYLSIQIENATSATALLDRSE